MYSCPNYLVDYMYFDRTIHKVKHTYCTNPFVVDTKTENGKLSISTLLLEAMMCIILILFMVVYIYQHVRKFCTVTIHTLLCSSTYLPLLNILIEFYVLMSTSCTQFFLQVNITTWHNYCTYLRTLIIIFHNAVPRSSLSGCSNWFTTMLWTSIFNLVSSWTNLSVS